MDKCYKFRLYPTANQIEQIERTFGCCRFVYNHFMNVYRSKYESDGSKANFNECKKALKVLKHTESWLMVVNASALKNALDELDSDFEKLADNKEPGTKAVAFPKMKTKKSVSQSYKISGKVVVTGDRVVQIPSLGLVLCRVSRNVEYRIISANVVRAASGYYIIINCTGVEQRKLPQTGRSVTTATPDVQSGTCGKRIRRIRRLKHRLSRKPIDSHNREKLGFRIERERERLHNRVSDEFHKLSTKLIKENDLIILSGYPSPQFRRQLLYKARWYGRRIRSVRDRKIRQGMSEFKPVEPTVERGDEAGSPPPCAMDMPRVPQKSETSKNMAEGE